MTALDHRTLEMPARVRPALGLRLINAVSAFLRAWKNRREIYHLGEMSDAQLADIGLVRGDLHVAWRTPMGTDPTSTLGSISEARLRAAEIAARRVR
jgi:uncharacterized protein YjiS (DUF1127 family)